MFFVIELKLSKSVRALEKEKFGNSFWKEMPRNDPACCSDQVALAACAELFAGLVAYTASTLPELGLK